MVILNEPTSRFLTIEQMKHELEQARIRKAAHTLHYEDLCRLTREIAASLIAQDPLFQDIPPYSDLEDLKAYLALQYGRSMKIFLDKLDGESITLIVPLTANVQQLKKLIQKKISKTSKYKISWRRVWKSYDIAFNGEPLLNRPQANVRDLGICQSSSIQFIRKRRSR